MKDNIISVILESVKLLTKIDTKFLIVFINTLLTMFCFAILFLIFL